MTQPLAHLAVEERKQTVSALDEHDTGAERPEDRRVLARDRPPTDDEQGVGHALQAQHRLGVVDVGIVEGHARWMEGARAGGDQDDVTAQRALAVGWANFCAAAGRPDWTARHGEKLPQAELIAELDALFAARTAAEWEALLGPVDCCFGAVVEPSEVPDHPQIVARGMIVEQDHPVLGRIRMPNLPFRFSDCDTAPTSTAPLLGQHNRSIAADLGYAPADVDAMVRDGVLYAEDAVARLPAA